MESYFTAATSVQLPLTGHTDDESFALSIALDIQFVFFLPRDWICKKSDLRHEIYYVRKGSVSSYVTHEIYYVT